MGTHRLLPSALLCALLLLACGERDPNALKPRPIAGDAAFAHARDVVQALADEDGPPGENHFCIVGAEGTPTSAWVYWTEGNRILLWEPLPEGAGESVRNKDLLMSRRSLRLDQDVAQTQEEVGTSTYLVTRAWVDELQAACAALGEKISVVKRES